MIRGEETEPGNQQELVENGIATGEFMVQEEARHELRVSITTAVPSISINCLAGVLFAVVTLGVTLFEGNLRTNITGRLLALGFGATLAIWRFRLALAAYVDLRELRRARAPKL